MVLYSPSVVLWSLIQFLNPIHSQQDSLDGVNYFIIDVIIQVRSAVLLYLTYSFPTKLTPITEVCC
jgi:hypothetical protein